MKWPHTSKLSTGTIFKILPNSMQLINHRYIILESIFSVPKFITLHELAPQVLNLLQMFVFHLNMLIMKLVCNCNGSSWTSVN